ncbi:ribosomal protein S18 [Aspergillus nidulans var. acristatus]
MTLPLLSSSPLRAFPSVVRLACRSNSTTSKSVANELENLIRPARSAPAAQRLPLRRQTNRQRAIEEERTLRENRLMEKFQTREWKAGDIYAPHDLSPAEMKKWNKRSPPTSDVFDAVNLNPLDVYKNFSIMSEYMTDMGRIKHRKVTGLRGVNQRKLAKAIRRAIGVGLMPSVHRHPEILAEIKFRTDGGF